RARLGDRCRRRFAHETGLTVTDDFERPPSVGRRHDGLLREEGFVRHHPEVFVDRGVVDGEAPRIEVRQLLLGDTPRELCAAVEAALASKLFQAAALRAL